MMVNYFLSTVRYEKTMENGLNKTVSEQYLFDALSFTEAEARTIEELKPYISGEFSIPQIVKPRISELMLSEDVSADRYYKIKVSFITLDEKSGAEKKTNSFILVQASDFKNAYDRFIEGMKGTMADYEIVSIVETQILDYYPAKYDEK
ncbi:MAG: DUF4494 domain-containing protein [Bacteroidaceae bacterium]|nr:DUF4494 domain-containing protein [Bacteroidaceae bacterium]